MQIPNRPPVVAAVNPTTAGLAAVRLAAREALARGTVLSVVHAFTWHEAADRRAAAGLVDAAVAIIQRSTPGVGVRGQLMDGPRGTVLRRCSRTAAVLVLGGDDSALRELVTQAWCPVVVTRGPRPPGGPLLAAVDGSEPSVLALRFAADEARRRGRTLDVVHVTAEGGEATGRRLLDDLLGAVPDLPPLRRRVLAGSPAGELVRASRRAGLIALGAARVGAVARELLQHSACPTVFVHGRKERPLSLPRVATVSKG